MIGNLIRGYVEEVGCSVGIVEKAAFFIRNTSLIANSPQLTPYPQPRN